MGHDYSSDMMDEYLLDISDWCLEKSRYPASYGMMIETAFFFSVAAGSLYLARRNSGNSEDQIQSQRSWEETESELEPQDSTHL